MSEIILPRDPDTLGFIIFGLREALKHAVETLAGQHDTQPGRWLDELEARCLRSVKRTSAIGLRTYSLEGQHLAHHVSARTSAFWPSQSCDRACCKAHETRPLIPTRSSQFQFSQTLEIPCKQAFSMTRRHISDRAFCSPSATRAPMDGTQWRCCVAKKMFTESGLERLRAPESGRVEFGDSVVPGLMLRSATAALNPGRCSTRSRAKVVRARRPADR